MKTAFGRWFERLLYLVAAILLSLWALASADAWWAQRHFAQRLLGFGSVTATPRNIVVARATRRAAHHGGLVGRITIPRLELSAVVVEGTDGRALRRGVGHLVDTPFPGEAGNVALAAHRDTYFRGLRRVRRGDRIVLSTPDGRFDYRVEWTRVVTPDRTDLLATGAAAELTLVTCYPFDWIGPAPDRFVVRARRVAPPAANTVATAIGMASGTRDAAITP